MKNDNLKNILPEDLACLNDFTETHPLKIDLVYANPDHKDNMFKEHIYKPDAKMWIHKELLPIVLRGSEICYKEHELIFELKDCLRTFEAQEAMVNSKLVQNNRHWIEQQPRLISTPGGTGHPRAMAIDIVLVNQDGVEVDMGTPFDYFTEDPKNNPAARNYTNFSDDEDYNAMVIANRAKLHDSIMLAAEKENAQIRPLSAEWWDFRFELDYLNTFNYLNEADLPPEMQMTFTPQKNRAPKIEPCV